MPPVIEMRGVTKRFPNVVANDQVDFTLEKGQIHALLGENGAGKSTLMNILYGLYRPDEGEIRLNGKPVRIENPGDAINHGIGMVHQHFMLIPVMTVAENMIVGNESTRFGILLDMATARKKITELSERYGLKVSPDSLIQDLPVGIRQRVEILKALYRKANVLILDEPTAVLTPEETDSLFVTLKKLTESGKSIIFITHKLKEVMRFTDQITVMRRGKIVAVSSPQNTTQQGLATEMVGREISLTVAKTAAGPGESVLSVHNLSAVDRQGAVTVDDVSINVQAGEILGLAGVQGNGQGEFIECLTGLSRSTRGSVTINGIDITNQSPRKIFKSGIAHIPEDRHTYGMVDSFSVADNLVLNSIRERTFSRWMMIDRRSVRENAENRIREFDIRPPNPEINAGSLSGGNQQKMVVAREFSRPIRLLIAAHPTRGLDVGSAGFIHEQIVKLRDQGCAVLVISAELDEIFALSDRIAVMFKGKIIASADAAKTDLKSVGLWMAGIA